MTLEEKAKVVGDECLRIGIILAEFGNAAKSRIIMLRIINVVIGMALFITLIPQFAATIGPSNISIITIVAAIVLLLDTILPLFLGNDSPERYEDYAKYIMGYRDFLDETLVDESLVLQVRQARLTETISLAQSNLRDVRAKWPKIVKKALGEL